jgi:hypothetical protein
MTCVVLLNYIRIVHHGQLINLSGFQRLSEKPTAVIAAAAAAAAAEARSVNILDQNSMIKCLRVQSTSTELAKAKRNAAMDWTFRSSNNLPT